MKYIKLFIACSWLLTIASAANAEKYGLLEITHIQKTWFNGLRVSYHLENLTDHPICFEERVFEDRWIGEIELVDIVGINGEKVFHAGEGFAWRPPTDLNKLPIVRLNAGESIYSSSVIGRNYIFPDNIEDYYFQLKIYSVDCAIIGSEQYLGYLDVNDRIPENLEEKGYIPFFSEQIMYSFVPFFNESWAEIN